MKKKTESFNDGYIVCKQAAMVRLNRRAPVIVNMKDGVLSIDRRVLEPVKRNEIVSLATGFFTTKCNSAYAVELLGKKRGDFAVLIVTDSPTVDQLNKLKASGWICLKDSGLYHLYNENNEFYVKDENERKTYTQGQTNIAPRANPAPVSNG